MRLEIAATLERNIRIIPVLVDNAMMPRLEDLPPDLARLTRRYAIELSDNRWAFDVDHLIQAIEGVLVLLPLAGWIGWRLGMRQTPQETQRRAKALLKKTRQG